jgi:hypothetical protein
MLAVISALPSDVRTCDLFRSPGASTVGAQQMRPRHALRGKLSTRSRLHNVKQRARELCAVAV